MKKTEVYKREYSNKEEYYNLIGKVKNMAFTEKNSNSEYFTCFDGDFFMRIYLDSIRKGGYDSKVEEVKVVIEKMGKNTQKDSKIETFLKTEGFKII